jgi:hypothetical protein
LLPRSDGACPDCVPVEWELARQERERKRQADQDAADAEAARVRRAAVEAERVAYECRAEAVRMIQVLNDLGDALRENPEAAPPLLERLVKSMPSRAVWQKTRPHHIRRAWGFLAAAGLLTPTHEIVLVQFRRRRVRIDSTRELARQPAWAVVPGRLWLDAEGCGFEFRRPSADHGAQSLPVIVAIGAAATIESEEDMADRGSYSVWPLTKGLSDRPEVSARILDAVNDSLRGPATAARMQRIRQYHRAAMDRSVNREERL